MIRYTYIIRFRFDSSINIRDSLSANRLSSLDINNYQACPLLGAKKPSAKSDQPSKSSDDSMTYMLLLVSFAFLVMNTPDHLLRNIMSMASLTKMFWLDDESMCTIGEVQKSMTFLAQTNFAVNFFLYSFAGRNFRREATKFVRRFWQKLIINGGGGENGPNGGGNVGARVSFNSNSSQNGYLHHLMGVGSARVQRQWSQRTMNMSVKSWQTNQTRVDL